MISLHNNTCLHVRTYRLTINKLYLTSSVCVVLINVLYIDILNVYVGLYNQIQCIDKN